MGTAEAPTFGAIMACPKEVPLEIKIISSRMVPVRPIVILSSC